MNQDLDLDVIRDELQGPHPSGRLTPDELGPCMAHLVWESFSDFLTEPEFQTMLARLGIPMEKGLPNDRAAEEILIFHMWAHSRAVELAFAGRQPDEVIRTMLDRMHEAVFEDMVANGTPRPQVPVFEQRVSARYADYQAAARVSDARVGEVARDHLADGPVEAGTGVARRLTERAVEVSGPLRDYLAGVEIVTDEG